MMFPDVLIELGTRWLEQEKSHWEGICSRIARHPRRLTDGFPQADLRGLIVAENIGDRPPLESAVSSLRGSLNRPTEESLVPSR
jgi:hypothetical protein